jgi:hypothetical protein
MDTICHFKISKKVLKVAHYVLSLPGKEGTNSNCVPDNDIILNLPLLAIAKLRSINPCNSIFDLIGHFIFLFSRLQGMKEDKIHDKGLTEDFPRYKIYHHHACQML